MPETPSWLQATPLHTLPTTPTQTGVQHSFLRISACVHGMRAPDAHYQAACEMLHSLAAGAADAADRAAAAADSAEKETAAPQGSRGSSAQSLRAPSPTMVGTTQHGPQTLQAASRPESPAALQSQPPTQNSHTPTQNGNVHHHHHHEEQASDHDHHPTLQATNPHLHASTTPGSLGAAHSQWTTAEGGDGLHMGPKSASVPPSGPALLALATQLASVCEGQLQLARACYQWVAMHTEVPRGPGATASVEAPLFADEAQVSFCQAGELLFGGSA